MSCSFSHSRRLLAGLLCVLAFSLEALAAGTEPVYDFCAADFAGTEPVEGVCLTRVPEASEGVLRLGRRILRTGDVLTAEQLDRMEFEPAASREAIATIGYLPIYDSGVAEAAVVTISIRNRADQPPVAQDSTVETYKNLPNEGLLSVTDPEGRAMVYTLVRSPKRGDVVLREDGSFVYTPKHNKVGADSFTFTAQDPAGNVSREATVTVRIRKPTDSAQYTDTVGNSCRFAAEWMKNTGIFSGETITGQACFCPEEPVTRGQFLSMLMEVLELPVDRQAQETGFLDEAEPWLKPYLAAALRSGIIQGYPCQGGIEFRPQETITACDASQMIQNALDIAMPVAAMEDLNATFLEASETPLTRADVAVVLYEVNCHQKDAGLKKVFQ